MTFSTKRAFDIGVAAAGLLLLLPCFAAIGIAILFDSRGPILYRSRRVGRRGRLFDMLKFRTMRESKMSPEGFATLEDDPRITSLGRWLRRQKLDELPQLLNVLRGEMSLVGPRPQVPELVAYYSLDERRTLEVVPGITDPASLRFLDEASLLRGCLEPVRVYLDSILPEKTRLSLEYLRRRSLASDFRVLGSTVRAVVLGQRRWTAALTESTTRA